MHENRDDRELSIDTLVGQISRRELRLPEMQRRYVWKKTQVRDLLDSLYRGYPSGSILTWETDEDVATQDFAIEIEQNTKGKNFQLLLDGQQRLTSLAAIISGQPIKMHDRARPIEILFNLNHPDTLEVVTEVNENDDTDDDAEIDENTMDAPKSELIERFERMAFVVSNSNLAAQPHWVSVTEVFRQDSAFRSLKAAGFPLSDDSLSEKYLSRLQQLLDIKKYPYRVHVLDRGKSYKEVTGIFVRVNSRGAKLRSSDLALAQITATWKNSLKIFENFKENCKQKNFALDLGLHLKNLVSFATGQSRFQAVSELSQERLEAGWENAKQGMDYALNFLCSNVNIDSPALLSSPFIIITVANYSHSKNYRLSPHEEQLLRYWTLVANGKGRYSRGSSETILDQDLAVVRRKLEIPELLERLRAQVGRLDVAPEELVNKNSRSAYFKTMFLAFRQQEAKDWNDQLVISLKHSGAKHSLQFHHIFPKAVLKNHGVPEDKINDICNLSFISGRTNREIHSKEPLIYLSEIAAKHGEDVLKKETLIKQAIPTEKSLWQVENYNDFLAERRKLVAARLNEFLGHDTADA